MVIQYGDWWEFLTYKFWGMPGYKSIEITLLLWPNGIINRSGIVPPSIGIIWLLRPLPVAICLNEKVLTCKIRGPISDDEKLLVRRDLV